MKIFIRAKLCEAHRLHIHLSCYPSVLQEKNHDLYHREITNAEEIVLYDSIVYQQLPAYFAKELRVTLWLFKNISLSFFTACKEI